MKVLHPSIHPLFICELDLAWIKWRKEKVQGVGDGGRFGRGVDWMAVVVVVGKGEEFRWGWSSGRGGIFRFFWRGLYLTELCQLLNTATRPITQYCGSCTYGYLNMCAYLLRAWQRSPDLHVLWTCTHRSVKALWSSKVERSLSLIPEINTKLFGRTPSIYSERIESH